MKEKGKVNRLNVLNRRKNDICPFITLQSKKSKPWPRKASRSVNTEYRYVKTNNNLCAAPPAPPSSSLLPLLSPGADPGFPERGGALLSFDQMERSERSVITAWGPGARWAKPWRGSRGQSPRELLGFGHFNMLKLAYFEVYFVT